MLFLVAPMMDISLTKSTAMRSRRHASRPSAPPAPRRLHLTALFFAALAVRTLRALQIPVVNADAIRFIEQAQRMPVNLLSALRTEPYHPLHAFAALLVHWIITPLFSNDHTAWLASVQVVGVLCGSIVALQIVWLARALGAPFWASLAAAAAWIVGRRTSAYGADGISDMLFLSLFAAAMLTAIAATRFRRDTFTRLHAQQFALTGFLAGLAYLARPEGLAVLLIVVFTLALLVIPRHRQRSTRKMSRKFLPRISLPITTALLGLGSMLIAAALPALPYMLAIGALTHKKHLVLAGIALHHPPLAAAFMATGSPFDKLMKLLMELMETFGFAPGLALLGAMLIAPRFWGRPRLRPLVITWIAVWIALMLWLMSNAGYLDGRHTLPLELILYPLLALAFVAWEKPMRWWMNWWRRKPTWNRLPRWMRWPQWPKAFAGGAVLLTLLPGVILLRVPPQEDQSFIRNAATWVRDTIQPGVPVYGAPRLVGYYAGHPISPWPGNPAQPNLASLPQDTPCLLIYTFRPSKGDTLQFAIGPYRMVALFKAPTGDKGDVLMIYALPGADIFRQPQIPSPHT
jgi:hypothetical protein